jgi:hypothetical protein
LSRYPNVVSSVLVFCGSVPAIIFVEMDDKLPG